VRFAVNADLDCECPSAEGNVSKTVSYDTNGGQTSGLIIYVKRKRSILPAEGLFQADLVMESMETLARRNHDLEARVEALEIANMKLLDGIKEWAKNTEGLIQRKDVQRDDLRYNLVWSVFDKV